jgi:hypothetical protein
MFGSVNAQAQELADEQNEALSGPSSEGLRTLSSEEIESEIVGLAARIAAATCRWLSLIAEFERRGAHEEQGFHLCATWLAWRCSISPRSAREHLRVARALEELPLIRGSMGRGEITYSKVRVLSRIATPELEGELLELARHATAAQLERVARAYGRALSAQDAERAHERRYLTYDWQDDGTLSIRGSLPAEDGALLLRALESGVERIREMTSATEAGGPAEPPGGSPEPPTERPEPFHEREPLNSDALALMAETLLAQGDSARPAGERTQVVVHVDSQALAGAERGPRRCETEDGAPLAPETARRLSCDASRVEIADGSQGPLDIGRRTRTVPAAMRRALASRDGGCRFPGCTHTRWTDAHHIRHWSQGGETSTENLVLLCRRHHRLVHEGGFRVDRAPEGEVRFCRSDGTVVEDSPPLRETAPRSRSNGAHQGRRRLAPLRQVSGDPAPLSAGDRMDLDLTVWILCSRASGMPRAP